MKSTSYDDRRQATTIMQNPPPVTDLLAELEAFREYIAEILRDDGLDWDWRPREPDWALNEIACHLRDVEAEVHQPRIQAILDSNNAFIQGLDADQWAGPRKYREQDGRAALIEFMDARATTHSLLVAQPAAAWQRVGQHTFFGPTTLQEIVYLAVQHDRVHAEQINNVIEALHLHNG
jgi:hypothetical protein